MKRIITSLAALAIFGTALASAQGISFAKDLQVGATGADVSALQTWLIQNGYHISSIESEAATKGFFGSQTKAAVQKYQSASKLPPTGFVGPLTRAKLNGGANASTSASAGFVGSSGCPEGFTCTAIGSVFPSGLPAGITTPGIPGIMSVTQGPLPSSTVFVGQTQVPIMTVRIQAQYSDIDFNGLVLDLGTDTSIYNKIFSKMYVTADNNVLFSAPLNSSSVVDVQGQYVLGTAGYDFIIPKGTYKDIIIKGDLYPSIDSKYTNMSPWYISVDSLAVSGLDGAGVILYGPSTDGLIVQALTINSSLVDTAQANISLDYSSPLKNTVPVTDTTNGQYNGLGVLAFDVNAQNDTLHLHEAKVQFVTSGTGQVSAAYLYNGSTLITSASVSNGIADFNNITDGTNGATVAKDTTTTFWVKADVTGVTSGSLSIVASTTGSAGAAPLTIYNSQDGNAIITGSAVGNTLTIANNGPVFTLVGAPTITKSNSSADQQGNSTTTYTATFNVQVQAVGTDVALGLAGSSTPAFGTTTDNMLAIYKNGAKDTLSNYTANSATIVSNYSQPTNTTLSTDGTYFTVSRNQSVTIPVTYSFIVKNAAASPATYAVQLQGINWEAPGAALANVNFMKDQVAWRTPAI